MKSKTVVTCIGNEGFEIVSGAAHVLIDAFYGAIPGVASAASRRVREVSRANLILVTHAHWDHFAPQQVLDAASRTGALVIGPQTVVRPLRGKLSPAILVEMEPASAGERGQDCSTKVEFPVATVTAYRTFHSPDHNSYLVEMPGFRFFHDGDNEDTRRVDASALGRLDALFIGPWQGSGWVEFIERVAPGRTFLMHLTEEELQDHEAGKFLPEICDHVPDGLVVLRPGESFVFSERAPG